MRIDSLIPRTPHRTRRTLGERLRLTLQDLSDGHAEFLSLKEQGWASITFTGSRHTISMRFRGEAAIAAGETLIAALPDHEFTLPGQLVADAAVVAVDHTLLPEPCLCVEAELLLLEDN